MKDGRLDPSLATFSHTFLFHSLLLWPNTAPWLLSHIRMRKIYRDCEKYLTPCSTAYTNLDSVSIKSHPIYFSPFLSISASLHKWQTNRVISPCVVRKWPIYREQRTLWSFTLLIEPTDFIFMKPKLNEARLWHPFRLSIR